MTVTLKAALADYPHVMALKDGSVRSDQVAFDWETVNPSRARSAAWCAPAISICARSH